VARAQLVAAGVNGDAIDRALRAGKLSRVHRGIYATVAPELLTEEGHLVAALLAAGDGALLSHGTAAWRWRIIPAPPSVITVATPRRHGAMPGVEVFGSARLRPGDTTHNGRFPTTSVARTLLDLATRYDRRALLRALAEAEFQHDLRPPDVERTFRRGHPGSANLRAALAQHAPGYGEMKSRLERRFRDLLIRHGIELPERNQAVGPWTVDCLWRERRVAVELDGRSTSVHTKRTPTTTATSGCAATATWSAATASARSRSAPMRSSPTSSRLSATPRRELRSGCCRPRPGGRCPRRSARE
jgi:hypothetical protein